MKKILMLVFLLPILSQAQIAVSADFAGGTPLQGQNYTDVSGSPYLFENWTTGTVSLQNGEKWESLSLNIDLVKGWLIFKDKDGNSKRIVKPIQSVFFSNTGNFTLIDNVFYQELVTGSLSLLKKEFRSVLEYKDYTTTRSQKTINAETSLYLRVANGGLEKVKLSEAFIKKTYPDLSDDLDRFSKESGSKIKTEGDLTAFVIFANNKSQVSSQ